MVGVSIVSDIEEVSTKSAENALYGLAFRSSIVRNTFRTAENNDVEIRIKIVANVSQSVPSGETAMTFHYREGNDPNGAKIIQIEIPRETLTRHYYIDVNGDAQQFSLERVLVHELCHADIILLRDFDSAESFPTAEEENVVEDIENLTMEAYGEARRPRVSNEEVPPEEAISPLLHVSSSSLRTEIGTDQATYIVGDTIVTAFNLAETRGSPLVLDLDNDGIELTNLNSTGAVYWDIDADGFREASGWVTGGDGLLAIDKNADGVINDNGELFGNSANVANGFDALAAYDSNHDTQITAADAAFLMLSVWVDSNGNGYSESGELHTLTDLGITSITTTYTDTAINNNGNMIEETSTFVQNGTTKSIVDAWFAYDTVNTVYNGDYTLDVRTLFMPTLRGYGNLPDLHIAMSLDNTGAGNLLDTVAALQSKTFARVFGAANDNKIAELFTARCLVQRVAA